MGALFSAVMVMPLLSVLLLRAAAPAPAEFASVTCQVMVRLALLAVGLIDSELNLTVLSAVVYCASVALPVNVNTPPALLAIVMPFWSVKLRISPAV